MLLRDLIICPGFFGHVGKRVDQKTKDNFKIYDIIYWEANNYNTHIAQYLKESRQSGNQVRSVNKV